jgi:AcrR family transcriptional regulator
MDRRVRRTRRQMRDALLALVMEHGYESVTIQQITDKADLSRATFYLHYKEKDELLADSLEMLFDDLTASMDASLLDFNWQRPGYQPTTELFEHVAEYSDLYSSLFLGSRSLTYVNNRAVSYISNIFEKVLRSSVPQDVILDTPIDIVARSAAGALFAVTLHWLDNGMRQSYADIATMAQNLIMPGVVAALGLPELAEA